MTAKTSILVVTPTLGESEFLDKTMASVASQPLAILHILSAPANRTSALAARYPHVRVIPDAGKSGGIYGALNAALAAFGEGWDWFTYLNDDDALLPRFSEMVRGHERRPNPEPVVYGDVSLIDERDRPIARITTERNPSWIPALLQRGISPLMQQGMLFRRETVERLGGFDLRYRLCADLDFWLRAYTNGARFRYYPGLVAQFRLRRGQLSGNTAVTAREQGDIVARHLPRELSRWRRRIAGWRYRIWNLPRYAERVRSRGFRTSNQLLDPGGER